MSELTQIKPIVADEKELNQLREDYEKLVVTEANLKDADKARLKLKNVRLDIQRQEKANNEVLKQIKKDNEDKAEKLIGIIHPIEKRLDAEITALEEAKKRKAEEDRLKEQNRVQGHRNRITGIAQSTARLALANNIEDIRVKVSEIEAMSGTFEEFEVEADEAIQLFKMSAGNRLEQLQRIEAEKKALEAQQKLELEEKKEEVETKTEPVKVDLEWEGDKVVAKESPDGKFKVAVIGEKIDEIKQYPLTPEEAFKPEDSVIFGGDIVLKTVNFSAMGYDFHIPQQIPTEYREKICTAITTILGEMPLL